MEGKKILGIDEVGRGCIAGPMFIAACIFHTQPPFYVLDMIKDSKKLSRNQRHEAFKAFAKYASWNYQSVEAEMIDEIGLSECLKISINRLLQSLEDEYDIEDFLTIEDALKADNPIVVATAKIIRSICESSDKSAQKEVYNEVFNYLNKNLL